MNKASFPSNLLPSPLGLLPQSLPRDRAALSFIDGAEETAVSLTDQFRIVAQRRGFRELLSLVLGGRYLLAREERAVKMVR